MIVISGAGAIDRVVESMKMGAFPFLQKPFDVDALTALHTGAWNRPAPYVLRKGGSA